MSSSRKNPNTARAYRERAQPEGRQRLGLLEKRKDYKLRAADHKEKKRKLRALQQKASERNADEFYFGMMSAKMDSRTGRKQLEDGGRGNKAMSVDVVRLLKTQDAGYLRTALQQTRKERERLEQEILVLEGKNGNRLKALKDDSVARPLDSDDESDMDSDVEDGKAQHTVFVDDLEQQQNFDAEEWFDTDAQGLEQAYNRSRRRSEDVDGDTADVKPQKPVKKLSAEAEKQAWKEERKQQKRLANAKQQRLSKLAAVKEREKSLVQAEQELDLQRAKMSNTTGGVNKNGVKFKRRERKK